MRHQKEEDLGEPSETKSLEDSEEELLNDDSDYGDEEYELETKRKTKKVEKQRK
jgi:hypothetical protein